MDRVIGRLQAARCCRRRARRRRRWPTSPLVGTLAPAALLAWLAAFGFLCAFGPVLIAHGKALFPPHLVGRALTLLNMGTMGGVFLVQIISGFVIGLFPDRPGRGLCA